MNTSTRRTSFGRVLLDMNTQCDFLLPKGALPVTNRADILPNIRKIMSWARIQRIPVLSSLESHRPDEVSNGLPRYCIDHSKGQKKLPFTLLPRRILLQGDNTLDLPYEPFRRYRQVIFTKRDLDFLSNPKADRLVNALRTRCFVVVGVLAEQCVKVTVLGLLARQRRIIVVRDACGCWCEAEAEIAYRQMQAKGAVLATAEELFSGEAEAHIDENRKPAVVDEPPPGLPYRDDDPRRGRPAGPDSDRAGAGDNGRAGSPRRGRPREDAPEPADIPRRHVKSPVIHPGRSPYDLA